MQKRQIKASPMSERLDSWLLSKEPKSLQGLISHFAEKSFAVLFLVLMAIPALPIPTGGITHIFEIVTMLLALELIVGLDRVWLPNRWRSIILSPKLQDSTLPSLVKLIRKVERYSRVRLRRLINNVIAVRLIGLVIFVFTLFAFLAPPFSGLDTLPALGVVIISIALILDDFILLIIGVLVGTIGAGLVISAGKLLINLIT